MIINENVITADEGKVLVCGDIISQQVCLSKFDSVENWREREITAEEEQEFNNSKEVIPYEQRVVNRIREVYSVDDELGLLRQRDTKPQEFAEYNAFVEQIKADEK